MRDFFNEIRFFLLEKRIPISSFVFFILIFHYVYKKNIPYDILEYPGYIGTILVILGIFLRSWAAGIIVKNRRLTAYGPYCLCRHPLYLGTLLISLGFCLLLHEFENIIVVLLFIVFVYLPKIKKEEEKLSKEFKEEWEEYCKKISKLIPNLREINYPWSFKLWIQNKEHYTFTGCLLGLIVVKLWNDIYF